MALSTIGQVWMVMLKEGRPMRHNELRRRLPELDAVQLGRVLSLSHQVGYVERDGTRRNYEYRVTPRCNVPTGIPVKEILEAVNA